MAARGLHKVFALCIGRELSCCVMVIPWPRTPTIPSAPLIRLTRMRSSLLCGTSFTKTQQLNNSNCTVFLGLSNDGLHRREAEKS